MLTNTCTNLQTSHVDLLSFTMSGDLSDMNHDEIMMSHTSTNMCPLECTPLDESLSYPFLGPHCQSPLPLPGLCCPPRPPPRPPPLLPNAPV